MMFDWISPHVADAIALAIVHSLWQGLLLACLVMVCTRMSYFQDQERAYRLHAVAMGLLFVCSVSTFAWIMTSGGGNASVTQGALSWTFVAQGVGGGDVPWWGSYWKELVALCWVAGTLFCMLRYLLSSASLIRQRRIAKPAELPWQHKLSSLVAKLGIGRRVTLLATDHSEVPFVFGALRPVIIFPAVYFTQLTPAQFESILLHELAHIRRNDFLINIIQICVESLLFFNPAVWWLSSRIRMHREFCCDDYVQSRITNRKSYLEALYNVACMSIGRKTADVGSVALYNNHSELIMRVKRMLNQPHTRTSLRPFVTGGLGALVVFCLFAFDASPVLDVRNEVNRSGRALKSALVSVFSDLPSPSVMVSPGLAGLEEPVALGAIDTQIGKPLPSPAFMSKRDSVPEDKRIAELEAEMEAKEKEMEALAREMEESMDKDLELHLEKMEETVKELEEMHELKADEIEARLTDSEDMKRLEELSEQMEERMEKMELEIDAQIDHVALEQLERQMELQMKDLEQKIDSLPPEERQRQMQEVHERMQQQREELLGPVMEQMREQMEALRDPAIRQIQEEMAEVQKRIAKTHESLAIGETAEMQELQEQLRKMERQIHDELTPMREEFAKRMSEKALEMHALAEELQKLHQEQMKEQQRMEKERDKR